MAQQKQRKLWTVVYRVGGSERFEWRRTLAYPTRQEAQDSRDALQRAGYKAHVEDYHASLSVGLPETFEPSS